eukprot:15431195-Heterocapsa_arctica.AAC.1
MLRSGASRLKEGPPIPRNSGEHIKIWESPPSASVHEHAGLLRVVRHGQRHRRDLVLDADQLGDALVAGGRSSTSSTA